MSITAEEIQGNWEKHNKIIDHYIDEPRKSQIKNMLSTFEEIYIMAPASGKSWYHNAFPGGYVAHVNNVVEYAIKQMDLYNQMGGTIDFTQEELVMSALFHDLGKIGNGEKPNYIPQTDKWRQDKLSEMFTPNPELDFMMVPDRSLYILQKFGIELSQKEFLAIKLHDGMFDDSNKPYFYSNQESSRMKTNIVNILHVADFLASKMEYDTWKREGGNSTPKTQKAQSSTGRTVKSSEGLTNLLKNI